MSLLSRIPVQAVNAPLTSLNLQGEVNADFEVGGNGHAPSRRVAVTSLKELYVLGLAGKHVPVGALPNGVMLRVHTAAQLADTVHGARSHHDGFCHEGACR